MQSVYQPEMPSQKQDMQMRLLLSQHGTQCLWVKLSQYFIDCEIAYFSLNSNYPTIHRWLSQDQLSHVAHIVGQLQSVYITEIHAEYM